MAPLQADEIFACLDRHGVRYVLIGGLAAFDWTGVAGADPQFTNPNGTGPDPVNGFGGVGGGFVLGGTGFAEPMATSPAMEVPPARPAAPPRRHTPARVPLIE